MMNASWIGAVFPNSAPWMAAADWLADRGYGRPIVGTVALAEERLSEHPIGTLDATEAADLLEAVRELRKKANGSNGVHEEANGDA